MIFAVVFDGIFDAINENVDKGKRINVNEFVRNVVVQGLDNNINI